MQYIYSLDKPLFRLINGEWHNGFFDWLMPWLRNMDVWMPLYLFLLLFVVSNYKKTGWWWVSFAACTVIIANFVSSNILKESAFFFRLRPCNDPEIAGWVRVLVGYRPQSSGFTSSHAANHFAMATYFYISLRRQLGKWPLLFFAWAFMISYAQMYVGVHYPIDVIAGALVGIVIGYLPGRLFNRNYGLA